MLGTNDLKMRFSVPAYDIANGVGVLIDIVQRSAAGPTDQPPIVLLMAPPPITTLSEYAAMFTGAVEKSRKFPEQYRRVADEYGCQFMDTSKIIVSSEVDGIHFDAGEHRKLGQAVAVRIKDIFETGT